MLVHRVGPAFLVLALASVAPGCTHRAPAAAPGAPVVEFTPIPEQEAAHAKSPHLHAGKPLCQACHVAGAAGVVGGDPIALCTQCHEAGRMKHPFGVPQPFPPAGLPLMAGGRIACHTCHDPHDTKARRAGLRLEYAELCLRCHVKHGTGPVHGR